jgi:hypothetical protein
MDGNQRLFRSPSLEVKAERTEASALCFQVSCIVNDKMSDAKAVS